LLGEAADAVPALQRALNEAQLASNELRVSEHIAPWVERSRRERRRQTEREHFLADVAAGKRTLDVVRHPLYEYQQEGMLHLVFSRRAILADDMGLGKTVQAVAACEMLRRLHGIERVLVISPVSLKTEWEEQIARFTDLPAQLIRGPRRARLRQYRRAAFFNLANYEQVLYDGEDMQRSLAPDVIILDEAQRIKNWQTKTADAVKRLSSPYAFVLTGTPLENRIDEIYSIAQVVDPHVFGPLFRFNRDFHELDDRGRPVGYKNLDVLHRRLRPVLLRRRKADVEGELPGRTVNTYFVTMHAEQRGRYDEFSAKVARIMQAARRRPLSPDEFKRLQQQLACMRMLCDTPYILDDECRVSPKLAELGRNFRRPTYRPRE
jgi:SNF2 family DNA or RNA helicase